MTTASFKGRKSRIVPGFHMDVEKDRNWSKVAWLSNHSITFSACGLESASLHLYTSVLNLSYMPTVLWYKWMVLFVRYLWNSSVKLMGDGGIVGLALDAPNNPLPVTLLLENKSSNDSTLIWRLAYDTYLSSQISPLRAVQTWNLSYFNL